MTTQTLATIQKSVQAFLLHQQGSLDSITAATETFTHAQRVGIYSHGYQSRLIEALENDYPALHAFLGNEQFQIMASQFIDRYPSKNPSLRWLGENLPDFLKAATPWKHHVGIQELAHFEWVQTLAFDANDSQPLAIEILGSLREDQWPALIFAYHPSLHYLQCQTNAPEAWLELVKPDSNSSPEIRLSGQQCHWVVWRKELQVLFRQIDDLEYQCLSLFMDQKTFSEVIGALSETYNEEMAVSKTAQYLQTWFQQGLIQAINIGI